MTQTVRVAALQMCSGLDPDRNIAEIARMADAAGKGGASYLLTPEVSVIYPASREALSGLALPFAGNPHIAALADIARAQGLHLHIGSLAIAVGDGRYFNRSVLFTPEGAVAAIYDKIHLFDANPPGDRPYRESDTYKAGEQAVLSDAPGFRLGFSICYDVRFPALYTALAGAGAEVIAIPAAFTVPTGRAHWEMMVRARAVETGCFVIAAAQGGSHENGRATWGRSLIVNPWGNVMAQIGDDQPGLIFADLALSEVADARARLPVLANRRAFSLSVNHTGVV